MSGPKPLASLSSGLLARKGAARPAMRPQGFGVGGAPGAALDDLGWNDMGAATAPAPVSAPVAVAVPAPVAVPIKPEVASTAPAAAIPPVLVEREALAERIEAPVPAREVSLPTARRLRRETSHAGKAALTLRLDSDRHLKLRLAGAITNRSAQDLLIQALDALIDAVPAVDALVAQLPAATQRKR
jgi:hypothetical protein